jgi:hypothetical protein
MVDRYWVGAIDGDLNNLNNWASREDQKMTDYRTAMNQAFLFLIGDVVYLKGSLHDAEHTPRSFVIIERHLQQNQGGIQRMYRLLGEPDMVPQVAICKEKPAYEWGDKNRSLETCTLHRELAKARREAGPKWSDMAQSGPIRVDLTEENAPEEATPGVKVTTAQDVVDFLSRDDIVVECDESADGEEEFYVHDDCEMFGGRGSNIILATRIAMSIEQKTLERLM